MTVLGQADARPRYRLAAFVAGTEGRASETVAEGGEEMAAGTRRRAWLPWWNEHQGASFGVSPLSSRGGVVHRHG